MKTREDIIKAVKSGRKVKKDELEDYTHLVKFFPLDNWKDFGFVSSRLEEIRDIFVPEELTSENIIRSMKEDIGVSFRQALNHKGISSGNNYDIIKTWLWVLDDELEDFDEYGWYGLPLYKAVALKYGFENPIGSNTGKENKYEDY